MRRGNSKNTSHRKIEAKFMGNDVWSAAGLRGSLDNFTRVTEDPAANLRSRPAKATRQIDPRKISTRRPLTSMIYFHPPGDGLTPVYPQEAFMSPHGSRIFLAAVCVAISALLATAPAHAGDTYKVLLRFDGTDGAGPDSSLIFDTSGNLYGTAWAGGSSNFGTAFQLVPDGSGGWHENVLYNFCSIATCLDGETPTGGLILDSAGNLYGTATGGGTSGASGVVFELSPGANGTWTESVLHNFCQNCADGFQPRTGLIFDAAGNLYGATTSGGRCNFGTVFELTPAGNGSWTEKLLHSFCYTDGGLPFGNLIFDSAGNLYGTTDVGGLHKNGCEERCGLVFELIPGTAGHWKEHVLHYFDFENGAYPEASLIFDEHGNLYGTAAGGGLKKKGLVFELTPAAGNKWTETVIHLFDTVNSAAPVSTLVMDHAGNLYGTSYGGYGIVFELSPGRDATWIYTVLHSFRNKGGSNPVAGLVLDSFGNLYGTTAYGGLDNPPGDGLIFEITP
jgi:uncharacterized repeat protein (TIGR03803 family)